MVRVEGVKSLLEFIQHTPGLRAPQIARAMGIPLKTLEHWIKQLRDQGKIEFRGSPKRGGYRKKDVKSGGASGGVNGGVSEGLSGGVKSVLAFIQKTPGLRAPQIARATGVPLKTIEKRLKKLKQCGDIEFRGSSRAGGCHEKA